ncbi:MAG: hypothetical protein A2X79_00365 [Desulfuromonadaceae bacterium GWB2_53_15]|nr:MAG: hypothetical protein A2X83_09010 [Desulfuromonadales bacterium GWD2_54_10]OHB27076.1 MAG: hypothetical protein A2X79_00365 [Desulfuromonadaceae bacterium GWB2_53_15]
MHTDPATDIILQTPEIVNHPHIDSQDTLKNLGNNIELYREILDLFNSSIQLAQQDLVTAIGIGALPDVLQHAHKIKGMSFNVGAKRYAELARQIEYAASKGNLAACEQWLRSLSTELPQLQDVIAAINWHELH